ncbi:organic cation transporter protein-like [Manduca sexta]|uniref:organic cation transporter protein-like n=1 Tax=Manduca sexta TaxID=7130 RepID=UPI001181FC64|nr:organic cation transporter protein-like [Manduca sexta]
MESNIDILANATGEFGRWQILLTVAMTLPVRMTAVWNHMAIIFLAQKTQFMCINGVEDAQNETCYTDCKQYGYHTDFDNTIISQWDLVCSRAWLANFNQTITMLGVLVGSVVFGFFADRRGRRPTLLTACTLQLIAGFAAPYCPDYWSFTTTRFFTGAATAGTMLTAFTLMMEMTGQQKRELMSCLCALPLTIGEMIMPAFAYYLRSWDKFSMGIAVPNVVFLVFFFLVPESPKWLISVGRLDEAAAVMEKVAKWNRRPPQNMIEIVNKIAHESTTDKPKEKASFLDLMRPNLRTKNLCSCITWFILGMSFYGSNQYIGQTSSNPFASISLAGVLQIPGVFLSGYLCKRFGRRITLITFLLVCGVSNSLLSVPDEYFYLKLVVGSVGVSSASGAFAAMYMYTTELFPTVARNMAMGVSSTASRIGSIIAPFVAGASVAGG